MSTENLFVLQNKCNLSLFQYCLLLKTLNKKVIFIIFSVVLIIFPLKAPQLENLPKINGNNCLRLSPNLLQI